MARTALTPTSIAIAGISPSYAAANVDGHSLANDGRVFLVVKNASGSPITVTIVTPIAIGGRAVADDTVSVPATTGEKWIGPFDANVHNQPSGADKGAVYIDFSAVTSVTCAAFKLP